MTLAGAILKKVKSDTSMGVKKNKYSSPPPEIEDLAIVKKKKKRRINKYATIRAKVDTTAPLLDAAVQKRNLITWRNDVYKICAQNMALLRAIKQMHFRRGKVDCKWDVYPSRCMLYYYKRVDFYNKVQKDNEIFYHRLLNTEPRIVSTSELRHDWKENRRRIVYGAQNKFVLFPPIPQESMEDRAFAAPAGVRRPRAYMTLCVRNCSVMGDLTIELFTDLCPNTCQLFLDLLDGDEVVQDHGRQTKRTNNWEWSSNDGFDDPSGDRKVPNLYWSGGDVVFDCGSGCYAQQGRKVPIGAENYHFSHSMPGLLSMKVTSDDEMCGTFNITFKALPQFDLKNVVFGRIIRPCSTFDSIRDMGSVRSTQPIVEIMRARRRTAAGWVTGKRNTKLFDEMKLRYILRRQT